MRIVPKLLNLLALAAALSPLPALAMDAYVASAATTALTIQQPATGSRRISFGSQFYNGPVARDTSRTIPGATVFCALASTATVSWNGTAATSTTKAEIALPNTSNASGVTLWTASNAGAGTTGPVYQIPAGGTVPIDIMQWIVLVGNGTAKNITITTSNTCTIIFNYEAQ